MRYLGGKARSAPRIAARVAGLAAPGAVYHEPFLGGAAVAAAVAKTEAFDRMELSDLHLDLVMFWRAVMTGWQPPAELTAAEYESLRAAAPSPLRGWAGFAASYNGKWMAGYGPTASGRDYLDESLRSTVRKAGPLKQLGEGLRIEHHSYQDARPAAGDVMYLDPPYAGTTGYAGTPPFDHDRFWWTAQAWAEGGVNVLVTEFSAPAGWTPVASSDRTATVDAATSKRNVEHLYQWGPA